MKWLLGLPVLVPLCASAVDIPVTRLDDPLPDGCSVGDCSLREAVLLANGLIGADRILLPASASPYRLTRSGSAEDAGLTGDLDVNGALEIAGQGAVPVVVSQVAVDRILHLLGPGAATTLRNVHLQDGRGVTQGGAVLAIGAQLVIVDAGFTGNVATSNGGAIAARCPDSGANVTVIAIASSDFDDNTAPQGGAVDVLGSTTNSCNVSIDDSDFRSNEATALGGAIAMSQAFAGSRLEIRDSFFDDNLVTGTTGAGNGGAVGLGSASITANISDSIFIDNRAEGIITSRGGAAFNVDAIVRSIFLANTARSGGALSGDDVEIEDSTFCDNVASQDGGALYASLGQVRRSTFCRNSASNEGGAMKFLAQAGDEVTIERSTFDANVAPTGGAIAIGNGGLWLYQSTFASVDVPAPGSTGTVLRYSGPQAAANGSFVRLTGNILRGTCSFANGIATVDLARHNANSGGNTCGLSQVGAQFSNNVTFTPLGGIPLLALADNGGPTVTRLPTSVAGHPAIGRVPLAQCIEPDQRYFRTTDASCDAGAVDLDGAPPPDAIFASGFES